MFIPIGTKVKLLHSNDTGTVTGWFDDGMVRVKLNDGMEIPVFPDKVIQLEAPKQKTKAKIIPGKPSKIPQAPRRQEPEQQYLILKDQGIQLAFEEIKDLQNQPKSFDVYLINATSQDLLFETELTISETRQHHFSGKLKAHQVEKIDTLSWDALNDHPVYRIICQRLSTQGPDPGIQQSIKIKPSQFFKSGKIKTAPILNRKTRLYKVFDSLEIKPEKKKEDLKAYTQRNTLFRPSQTANSSSYQGLNLAEVANFSPEIDLHITALLGKKHREKPDHYLDIQVARFKEYLDKAILLGLEQVFIIHGVGNGTLKTRIHKILSETPEVKSYKNEFHPKYKFGATEVVLR